MESGCRELDASSILGLDCVSFASSGLSPPIVVTNCESCLSLGSKVTNSNGTQMICITVIWREERACTTA